VLVDVAGVCKRGDMARVAEFPYGGESSVAFVEFEKPAGDRKGYPFRVAKTKDGEAEVEVAVAR
jgi:hypothetical protein